MGAWTSRTRIPMPEPDPQEALDLSRLPPELLLLVLSHVPPRTLLVHCRRVCRAWRALVDGQALWLLLLARDHSAAGRALLTLARRCLPPAREGTPCPLGQFCALRPLGRNLLCNPCGQGEALRGRGLEEAEGRDQERTVAQGAGPQECQWAEPRRNRPEGIKGGVTRQLMGGWGRVQKNPGKRMRGGVKR